MGERLRALPEPLHGGRRALGKAFPGLVHRLRLEFGEGSQINVPIAVLLWLMIYPMMLRIDFASVWKSTPPEGLAVTLFVNWLVKPFSMAFLGWLFFKPPVPSVDRGELADQYIAGVIILAAAPCTAMVFVWSYLTDGDPAYTLVQVSVNDLIMLVALRTHRDPPRHRSQQPQVPFAVLLYSVGVFVVIPLALGLGSRAVLMRRQGRRVVRERFLPTSSPSRSSRCWPRWC
jgi:arsenite transporter